jgi:hypothetical protein
MERISMLSHKRAEENLPEEGRRSGLRLLAGLGLAVIVVTVLIMSMNPGAEGGDRALLSQALLHDRADLQLDSQGLASRVVEQKFQIHMEEMDQSMGEIPYVEVWVLNDPFYPLMGDVADLRSSEGTLAGKEWQMLGYPNYDYEEEAGTTTGAPTTSPPSATPVTTGVTERAVIVESIYEIRGIKYATIRVNDDTYDKLKAGSEFAEVFKVQEFKDDQTVVVLCGDETYELEVDQIRRI